MSPKLAYESIISFQQSADKMGKKYISIFAACKEKKPVNTCINI